MGLSLTGDDSQNLTCAESMAILVYWYKILTLFLLLFHLYVYFRPRCFALTFMNFCGCTALVNPRSPGYDIYGLTRPTGLPGFFLHVLLHRLPSPYPSIVLAVLLTPMLYQNMSNIC